MAEDLHWLYQQLYRDLVAAELCTFTILRDLAHRQATGGTGGSQEDMTRWREGWLALFQSLRSSFRATPPAP